jgi:hypothetical protein
MSPPYSGFFAFNACCIRDRRPLSFLIDSTKVFLRTKHDAACIDRAPVYLQASMIPKLQQPGDHDYNV